MADAAEHIHQPFYRKNCADALSRNTLDQDDISTTRAHIFIPVARRANAYYGKKKLNASRSAVNLCCKITIAGG